MPFGLAQVLAGDALDRAADLQQRRGERAGAPGEHGRAAVGGELAVARERAQQQEGDRVDEPPRRAPRTRCPPPLRCCGRSRRRRRRSANWAISAASVAKKLASVITITSRLITCVSSCAITPSSSAVSSSSRIPRVAQTVVDFCERPIAKALGIEVSITHTRGLGRSACTHSRSMIPCSSGSSAGETSLTPSVAIAILSEANSCSSSSPTATTHDHPGARAGGEQHADEDDVDEPEQEHRQQHPGLQTGVATEVRMWCSHRAHSGRRAVPSS